MPERLSLQKSKNKPPVLVRHFPDPQVLAREPANHLLLYQQKVGNRAVQQLLRGLPEGAAGYDSLSVPAGLVQRDTPAPGTSPANEPGKAPRILTPDDRMKAIEEVGSRITDVARKWTLAIALVYTDKKTEPDSNLWGPLFEALFTFASGYISALVVPALAKAYSHLGVGDFLKKLPAGGEATLAQIKDGATKLMEPKFKNIHDSMAKGVLYWVKDKAKVKNSSGDEKAVASAMSNLIGYWGEQMRREYITNTPDNSEGDLALLSAEELFSADNHDQEKYNQKVVEDWERIETKVMPVVKGKMDFKDEDDLVLNDKTRLVSGIGKLKLAYITYPTLGGLRLAVVDEFIYLKSADEQFLTGQYAFKEWGEPELNRIFLNSEDVRAKKNTLDVNDPDLVNAKDPEILSWVQDLLSAQKKKPAGQTP